MIRRYLKASKHYKNLVYGDVEEFTVPICYGDFNFMNTQFMTWCDAFARASILFLNAELKSRLTMSTPTAVLGFSDYYHTNFKEEDQETRLERLEFILSKMKSPSNGLNLSLYEISDQWLEEDYDGEGMKVTWPFHTLTKWPLIDSWSENSHSDYVSFQKTEKLSYLHTIPKQIEIENKILDLLDKSGTKIKFVSYDQKSDYIYDTILNARYHVSYCGASWWLAQMLNTPVYSYGLRYQTDKDLFGSHSSGMMTHDMGMSVPITVEDDIFKYTRASGLGCQLDWDTDVIVSDLAKIGII